MVQDSINFLDQILNTFMSRSFCKLPSPNSARALVTVVDVWRCVDTKLIKVPNSAAIVPQRTYTRNTKMTQLIGSFIFIQVRLRQRALHR